MHLHHPPGVDLEPVDPAAAPTPAPRLSHRQALMDQLLQGLLGLPAHQVTSYAICYCQLLLGLPARQAGCLLLPAHHVGCLLLPAHYAGCGLLPVTDHYCLSLSAATASYCLPTSCTACHSLVLSHTAFYCLPATAS